MSTVLTRLPGPENLEELRRRSLAEQGLITHRVRVCLGTGCVAKGAAKVFERFRQAAEEFGEESLVVQTKCTGCHGFCERGPIVVVDPGDVFYPGVKEEDVPEIWRETAIGGRLVERLLYKNEETGKVATRCEEIPFYRAQQRIVLAYNGVLDPTRIEEYLAAGGYAALAKALTSMQPEEVLEEVSRSGLRGRGGGGFFTGRKWRSARNAPGRPKYVIANGDEGDPGAFMDRSLMEGAPHTVIEGMIIGGYAIGSSQGYLYVRNEYPLAVQHLTLAIGQARELGLLGENILGSGFDFDIEVRQGAGAFVCGEETALIASIEGERGMPRPRPPFPAQSGLYGKPTNINNVETWANVPRVIEEGGEAYATIGTETSKGTKIFALAGRVRNTGLVEVPMGATLRRIVFDIGGGIPEGREFKAAQMGGPSGGCVPGEHLDLPIDYDSLKGIGAIMGSGGMIVMDESTCMVDIARFFTEFVQSESCGKCVPCRIGTKRMLEILTRICGGEGEDGDVDRLARLGGTVQASSLCGLGQTAPNPVLSTIRYFGGEYDAHVGERRCPAGACLALVTYRILSDQCTGCGVCLKACPAGAVSGEKKQPHVIDPAACVKCGACRERCRFDAIIVE